MGPQRKSYNVKTKLEVLEKLRHNEGNISKTANENNITPKMLRDWLSKENNFIETQYKRDIVKIGSGRKPFYPEVELELYAWTVNERKVNKRVIKYNTLKDQALQISSRMGISLTASVKWISSFLRRHSLSCRKITHVGQENQRSHEEIRALTTEYLAKVKLYASKIGNDSIYNMDETPVYIDMVGSRTISFKGEKNTEVNTTGNSKSRITVVLCISKNGNMMKSMVILKGLKKVPKCNIPSNLFVVPSNKGSMTSEIMKIWIKTCFDTTGPFNINSKKLLIMDEFASHKCDEVMRIFEKKSVKIVFIPPRCTHYLQPLDVSINSIFKASLKREWDTWMISGKKDFTKKGYRKKPEWEETFKFISRSIYSVERETIQRSFPLCGIFECKEFINQELYNSKLKSVVLCNPDEIFSEENFSENDSSSDDFSQ